MSKISKTSILYLSGKAGCGKSMICEWLNKRGYTVVNIADRIKEVVSTLTGTPLTDQYTTEGKAMKPEGLEILGTLGGLQQTVGTLFRTHLHRDVWIHVCWNHIEKMIQAGEQKIVIGDVRMKREAQFFEEKGVHGIRIERPRVQRLPYIRGRDEKHITETDLDTYDFAIRIHNGGTKESLFKRMEGILINTV